MDPPNNIPCSIVAGSPTGPGNRAEDECEGKSEFEKTHLVVTHVHLPASAVGVDAVESVGETVCNIKVSKIVSLT